MDTAPWGTHVATADAYAVPQAFFTDPEAGSVGLTAEEATQRGHRVRTVDVNIGESVAGAVLFADGYSGQARIVVDLDREILLGVSLVGPGVGTVARGDDRCHRQRYRSDGCGMRCRASQP